MQSKGPQEQTVSFYTQDLLSLSSDKHLKSKNLLKQSPIPWKLSSSSLPCKV